MLRWCSYTASALRHGAGTLLAWVEPLHELLAASGPRQGRRFAGSGLISPSPLGYHLRRGSTHGHRLIRHRQDDYNTVARGLQAPRRERDRDRDRSQHREFTRYPHMVVGRQQDQPEEEQQLVQSPCVRGWRPPRRGRCENSAASSRVRPPHFDKHHEQA